MGPPKVRRMKYGRCTDEELENFCRARGIDFKPFPTNLSGRQLRQSRREHHQTLVESLHQADANPKPFRFLDLSAELRTAVYENLLVFENSFGCHPQILQTSRQVNDEANNILYGNNLIEAKMWDNGLYIHGRAVGQWPLFILKAQFLRISFGNQNHMHPSLQVRQYEFEADIHDLCCYLCGRHKLRSVAVDFTHVPVVAGGPKFDLLFDTYALRKLGSLKQLTFEGVDGVFQDYQPKSDPVPPMRVDGYGPDEAEDKRWTEFHRGCLAKRDQFLVDCHKCSSPDDPNHIFWPITQTFLNDMKKTPFVGLDVQSDVNEDANSDPFERIMAKETEEDVALAVLSLRTGLDTDFELFVEDLRYGIAGWQIPVDYPAFSRTFFILRLTHRSSGGEREDTVIQFRSIEMGRAWNGW